MKGFIFGFVAGGITVILNAKRIGEAMARVAEKVSADKGS